MDDPYDRLYDQYDQTDDPQEQIGIVEQLIRAADAAGDLHEGYHARMQLIGLTQYQARKDKSLVAFSWCLGQADQHPDEFDPHELLWKFKWMLEFLPASFAVSKEKIHSVEDEMETRLLAAGYNCRPVEFLRWNSALMMDDHDRCNESFAKWKSIPRDEMADCEACELHAVVRLHAWQGDDTQAIHVAKNLVSRKLSCMEVPEFTYQTLVRPYLRTGQMDTFLKLQPGWYEKTRTSPDYLSVIAELAFGLTAANKINDAAEMILNHTNWAAKVVDHEDEFVYTSVASIVLERFAKQGSETLKRTLPPNYGPARDARVCRTEELAHWFKEQASAISQRFDKRNGNDFYQRRTQDARELIEQFLS